MLQYSSIITSHMRDNSCMVTHKYSHVKFKFFPCKSWFTWGMKYHKTWNAMIREFQNTWSATEVPWDMKYHKMCRVHSDNRQLVAKNKNIEQNILSVCSTLKIQFVLILRWSCQGSCTTVRKSWILNGTFNQNFTRKLGKTNFSH